MLWNQQAKGLGDVDSIPPEPLGLGADQEASELPAQIKRLPSHAAAGALRWTMQADRESTCASGVVWLSKGKGKRGLLQERVGESWGGPSSQGRFSEALILSTPGNLPRPLESPHSGPVTRVALLCWVRVLVGLEYSSAQASHVQSICC